MNLKQITLLLHPDVYASLLRLSQANGRSVKDTAQALMLIGMTLGDMASDPDCHVYLEENGEMHELTIDGNGEVKQ